MTNTTTPTPSTGAPGANDDQLVRKLIVASGKANTDVEVESLFQEYKQGKPLAYITGTHHFGSLHLTIRPPIYIPRVETEQWVLLLSQSILSSLASSSSTSSSEPFRILDICSGSGCIPLLLAHQGQGLIHTVGLEVDDAALSLARENAERNGISHLSTFEKFDLFEDDPRELVLRVTGGKGFDMVVSNPPYVSSEDMKLVAGKWWEGNLALQGKLKDFTVDQEDDGLSFYRRIKEIYTDLLRKDRKGGKGVPKLVLEIGSKQSPPVKEMFEDEGRLEVTKETERRKDLSTPKLEEGDMVGTERSIWIYDE